MRAIKESPGTLGLSLRGQGQATTSDLLPWKKVQLRLQVLQMIGAAPVKSTIMPDSESLNRTRV